MNRRDVDQKITSLLMEIANQEGQVTIQKDIGSSNTLTLLLDHHKVHTHVHVGSRYKDLKYLEKDLVVGLQSLLGILKGEEESDDRTC